MFWRVRWSGDPSKLPFDWWVRWSGAHAMWNGHRRLPWLLILLRLENQVRGEKRQASPPNWWTGLNCEDLGGSKSLMAGGEGFLNVVGVRTLRNSVVWSLGVLHVVYQQKCSIFEAAFPKLAFHGARLCSHKKYWGTARTRSVPWFREMLVSKKKQGELLIMYFPEAFICHRVLWTSNEETSAWFSSAFNRRKLFFLKVNFHISGTKSSAERGRGK